MGLHVPYSYTKKLHKVYCTTNSISTEHKEQQKKILEQQTTGDFADRVTLRFVLLSAGRNEGRCHLTLLIIASSRLIGQL
jgi:hypothetical protein